MGLPCAYLAVRLRTFLSCDQRIAKMLPCTLPSNTQCKGVTHLNLAVSSFDLPDLKETLVNTSLTRRQNQNSDPPDSSVFHCIIKSMARREKKAACSRVRA